MTMMAKGPPTVAESIQNIGRSAPLGATVVPGGVNFSVYSRNASGVELLLFEREDNAIPARVITIDPDRLYLPLLACICAGCSTRPAIRVSSPRAIRSRERHAVRCR